MANIINAITTGAGGLSTTADTSGNVSIQSNGSTVLSTTSSGVNVTGTFTVNGAPISVLGGATQTTTGSNITLTSSSNRVQEITPTANITVTLPNATTLSTGTPIFTITNVSSSYTITLALAGGGIIKYIGPGVGITLSLVSNSTSNGLWEVNLLPPLGSYGAITAFEASADVRSDYSYSLGYGNSYIQNILLSSTSVVTLYAKSTGIYAVAATISGDTITYGSPTLIQSYLGNNAYGAVGLSSSNILIWAPQSGTNPKVYGLTVSGTTITVSTASAAVGSYGNYLTGFSRLSDTEALVAYYADASATTYGFRVVTHNGSSAPTLGTVSSTISAANVYTTFIPITLIPLTSTTTLAIYCGPSPTYYLTARVITTSGSSAPTLGTALTTSYVSGAGTINGGAIIPYSSTEVATIFSGVGPTLSFNISGTTVTLQANTTTSTYSQLIAPSWGTSTTSLACDYNALYKLTYTPGTGVLNKSGNYIAEPSGYTYFKSGNALALDSTRYYMTSYGSNNSGGYGQILTIF